VPQYHCYKRVLFSFSSPSQRVRECKQPFLKAITAKRNKSAAANARLVRKAERDRMRRIASNEKAKGGSGGGGAAAEDDGDGDEGPQPFQLDAEAGDLPKRRKSLAQRLGTLANKAASAVAGTTRGSNDRTGGGSVSPTSPSCSFRASLSRRSSSMMMMTAGSVAVRWGDNVHHTVSGWGWKCVSGFILEAKGVQNELLPPIVHFVFSPLLFFCTFTRFCVVPACAFPSPTTTTGHCGA